MKKSFRLGLAGIAALSVFANVASAGDAFDYSTVASLTNGYAETLIEQIGIGGDHRALNSASSLGMVIGLDVGIAASGFTLSQDFKDALTAMGNTQDLPPLLPVPKIVIGKGLPFGLDLGASWVGFGGNSIIGGEAKYSVIDGGLALPSLAVKASYTRAEIAFVKANTTKLDVMASKRLLLFDPYVGAGYQFVKGTLEVTATGLPGGVTLDQSSSAAHFYAGLPIHLAFLRFAAEYDQSLAGYKTISTKLSLSF